MVAPEGWRVHRLSAWAELRSAPVIGTVAMLVGGLSYSIFGSVLVHGGPLRLSAPSDLWGLAGSASALVHGQFSHIYIHNGALTSPPALEFLLAPVIYVGQLLGLTPHLHPSGEPLRLWFLLGPSAILIGSSSLFAVDAIARSWLITGRERMTLAMVGGLAVANVVVGWGHPEDCVSLALVLWAALDLDRKGMEGGRRAAWLLGVAIAFQPLAILGVAPIMARLGWRRSLGLSYRLVLPSLLVLIPSLATEVHRTLFVLIRQPFQPRYVSSTPLSHWAPSLGPGVAGGGPTRLLATALGAGLCLVVCHKRHDLATVLAMMALAFFLRVLLETEMNWYYLWPVAALCLLLARRTRARYALCAAAAVAGMVLGNHRVHEIALWWPALMASTLCMLLTVFLPVRPGSAIECDGMQVPTGSGLQHE